ncbi:MAG TPA: FHA domain-containing protein [Gemmatales bacterium]|nr:FHA domain-containing protein [Gemmatales bacterium]
MSRWRRLYDHALYGALDGLLAWMLFGTLIQPTGTWWLSALVGGGLIGAAVGGTLVGLGPLLDGTWRRCVRFTAVGTLLGLVGGAVGFWVGEAVHYALLPGATAPGSVRILGALLDRALGWMIFGLAIGMAEGLAMRSVRKMGYGAIGGTLGGLVGGAVFGTLMTLLTPGASAYLWGQMFGLMILAAAIGLCTALVEDVLRPAALRVVRGWREGREHPLLKSVVVVGRDEAADVLLLRDMNVAKRHAIIRQQEERFLLELAEGRPEHTLRNHEPVLDGVELHDGDRLQFGSTVLRFSRRSTPSRQPASTPVLTAAPA